MNVKAESNSEPDEGDMLDRAKVAKTSAISSISVLMQSVDELKLIADVLRFELGEKEYENAELRKKVSTLAELSVNFNNERGEAQTEQNRLRAYYERPWWLKLWHVTGGYGDGPKKPKTTKVVLW